MMRLLSAKLAVGMVLLCAPAQAAIIGNLGANPVSAGGNFQASPPAGAFTDQLLFQLVGAQVLTIASVTNTFAQASDFIVAFTAAVWNYGPDNLFKTADDVIVIGPVAAGPNCGFLCQGMGGSANLVGGLYYAEFSGIAGSTSGYAGNISTNPVPIPGAAVLFLSGLAGLGGLALRRRRKQAAVA